MVQGPEQHEFDVLLKAADGLSMKMKRQLYSAMRSGAPAHTLVPQLGMTLGEVAMFLVLRERA